MNPTDWVDHALAAVMDRVTTTEAAVGDRFPLYAEPGDGRWTTTGRGSWTGGFWTGLLWLRARYTGDDGHRRAAAAWTARLAPWAVADTATRGLIFWYGTAPAGDDPAAAALRATAAEACLAAYDPALGIVPWGAALGGPRLLARADAVPGMTPLLACAGTEGAAAAAAHLHRHLDLCLGGEGRARRRRPVPAWHFDAEAGWQPRAEPAAGWSRGEAWLLLAVAEALLRPYDATHRPDRLRTAAQQLLSDGGLLNGPLVPAAQRSGRLTPLDTSAAAITAVALLKLSCVPGPLAPACSYRAVAVLRRLADAHLTGAGSGRPAGMLLDGCYDADRGPAVRHELIWGDYFLALGLAALDGLVDITRVEPARGRSGAGRAGPRR
ncbi:sugar ABC transporter permease [Streptomyces sp. NPDC006430]|uniref:sugar ABC transporter permease n=1 Tax=Streptomyces sp. NPDC006430 TaxID=3154299 RepID=UPI0033BB16AA